MLMHTSLNDLMWETEAAAATLVDVERAKPEMGLLGLANTTFPRPKPKLWGSDRRVNAEEGIGDCRRVRDFAAMAAERQGTLGLWVMVNWKDDQRRGRSSTELWRLYMAFSGKKSTNKRSVTVVCLFTFLVTRIRFWVLTKGNFTG